MKYYCTRCGSANLRKKTKTNYGCGLALIDLVCLIAAFFTFGLTLIGCIIIACCVKRTQVCRKCGAENTLIPMDSPAARAATATS